MSKLYRYILGIDLGIASVGTALIKLDENGMPTGILDLGVRIFDTPEGAADRRVKRQARKTLQRRKLRQKKLASFLKQHGMLPADRQELKQVMHFSPYRTRALGARGKYASLYELGRSLLHLAKFRGASFLTELAETAEEDGEEKKQVKDKQKSANTYRALEARLKKSGQTLSEYFHKRLTGEGEAKKPIRRRALFIKENLVDYSVPRFLVKEDFHRIWDKQAEFYPQLTPELKAEAYKLVFADTPHAPYAVGKCSLNPAERRLPKMHRLSEERRIYEQINNIRVVTRVNVYELPKEARDLLAVKALSGESLGKKEITKLIQEFFPEKIESIKLPETDEKPIKGFAHVAAFKDIPAWQAMTLAERDNLIEFMAEPRLEPDNINSRLMPEDDYLREIAKRLALDNDKPEDVAAGIVAKLPKDHAMLGKTASEKVLEKLKEGHWPKQPDGTECWKPHSNRTAADACGYTAEEEIHRAMAGKYASLPYYGELLRHDVAEVHPWHLHSATPEERDFGRIPNPVVHVALNQLRKIVNEIIELYGKPQRIHVEFSRDLGKSKKKREEDTRKMQTRQKENTAIEEDLRKNGIPATSKNILRYRLWKEQNGQDIYTLQNIGIADLQHCEIDHLIPQSHGGSDTYMNLALTHGAVNLAKGNQFPHEFIQASNPDAWQHILKLISDKKKYPEAKAWRFLPSAKEKYEKFGDEEQTDSRMTDTSYMAKMGARYLSAICPDVVCLKGGITAKLRHLWGLDCLEYDLMGLPRPEKNLVDETTGEVTKNPAYKAKPRYDHRHHALDAVVAACTTRSTVQLVSRIERLDKQLDREQREKLELKFSERPVPFGSTTGEFRQKTLEALQKLLVSPKPEHGKAGQLHDATKYCVLEERKNDPGSYLIRYRRKLELFKSKEKLANNIIFNTNTIALENEAVLAVYELSRHQKSAIESRYIRAEELLRQQLAEDSAAGKKPFAVTEERIVAKAIELAQKEDPQVGHHFFDLDYKRLVGIRKREQCGFEPKSNFCTDFYETPQGKVGWECVTRFHANRKDFKPAWQQEGGKLIWRVWNGDVLQLEVTPEMRDKYKIPAPVGNVLFTVQKMSPGILVCNILSDARALTPTEPCALPRWTSGNTGLSFFTQARARKIELTPFGKIARKHKRLWHGKKTRQKP